MKPFVILQTEPGLSWNLQPALVGVLLLVGAAYALAASNEAHGPDSKGPARAQHLLAFAGGLLLIYAAFVSPLAVGADRLFSLHMLQHVILSSWVPPLLLLGLTPRILRQIFKRPSVVRIVRSLTHPLVGAPIFMANMWFWHVPPVYDFAVANGGVHALLHISLVLTGVLFWWTVVSPEPKLHNITTGWRALYVLIGDLPMMFLAFFLVAAQSSLYGFYEYQPRLWGISPLTDQQLGGATLGALGEITLFIPFTRFFFRLMAQDGDEALTSPSPTDATTMVSEDARR